jgi:hypothetical protein
MEHGLALLGKCSSPLHPIPLLTLNSVAPIATFKGAANVNAASYAVAGLAAAAALVMA